MGTGSCARRRLVWNSFIVNDWGENTDILEVNSSVEVWPANKKCMNLKEAATCSHEHCGVWMEIRSDSFLWPNIYIAFVYVFWGWNSNSCPKQILSGTKNRLSWAVTQKRNCTDTHKYTSGDMSGQHESLWKYWPSACLYRLSSMKNWLAKCHVLSYWKYEAFQRVIEDEMSPRRGRHAWRGNEKCFFVYVWRGVFECECFPVCQHFVPVELLTVCGCSCSV